MVFETVPLSKPMSAYCALGWVVIMISELIRIS